MKPMKFGIGQSVRRVEDERFITGKGRYASDYAPEGVLQAYVLRSPHAHAAFSITDVEEAKASPGVHLVLTQKDVAQYRDLTVQATVKMADGTPFTKIPYPLLAKDRVRHVGDAVAFIVAETLEQAKDAAEKIVIEYDTLDAVVDMKDAVKPDAPVIWPERGTNIAFETHVGNRNRTEAAFAKAAKIVPLDLINNRLVANYLEARALVAEYDASEKSFTITMGSQGSHIMQSGSQPRAESA